MTLDYKKIAKLKVQEVMKDLPKKLKDPKCYPVIEKKLALVMFSDHTHPSMKSFVKCKRCSEKHQKKRELITEFGFTSLEQYLFWKRIMDIIVNQKAVQVSSKFVK